MPVLVPYKLTLLSNGIAKHAKPIIVLVPYKLTLLSNDENGKPIDANVLVPYKLTLLSNIAISAGYMLLF